MLITSTNLARPGNSGHNMVTHQEHWIKKKEDKTQNDKETT